MATSNPSIARSFTVPPPVESEYMIHLFSLCVFQSDMRNIRHNGVKIFDGKRTSTPAFSASEKAFPKTWIFRASAEKAVYISHIRTLAYTLKCKLPLWQRRLQPVSADRKSAADRESQCGMGRRCGELDGDSHDRVYDVIKNTWMLSFHKIPPCFFFTSFSIL